MHTKLRSALLLLAVAASGSTTTRAQDVPTAHPIGVDDLFDVRGHAKQHHKSIQAFQTGRLQLASETYKPPLQIC